MVDRLARRSPLDLRSLGEVGGEDWEAGKRRFLAGFGGYFQSSGTGPLLR